MLRSKKHNKIRNTSSNTSNIVDYTKSSDKIDKHVDNDSTNKLPIVCTCNEETLDSLLVPPTSNGNQTELQGLIVSNNECKVLENEAKLCCTLLFLNAAHAE